MKKAKLAAAEKPAGLRVEAKCVTQEKSVVSCPTTGTSHTSARWTKSAFSDVFAKYSVEVAGHYGISYNIIDLQEERRNYRENTQLFFHLEWDVKLIGSAADPCHFGVDPDPANFIIDLQDANKKLIF